MERAGLKAAEDEDPDDVEEEPRGVQRSAMPERLGWGDGEGILEERRRKCRKVTIEMRGAAMSALRQKERVGGIESGGGKGRLKREAEKRGFDSRSARRGFSQRGCLRGDDSDLRLSLSRRRC